MSPPRKKIETPKTATISTVDIFAPAPGQLPRFRPMLQGQGTNRLTNISGRRQNPNQIDQITGLATFHKEPDFTVFIEKYNQLTSGGLRVSTHKLLDICAMALTAQNDYRGSAPPNTFVVIELDDYMRQCGIPLTKPSRDKARRRVKEDLEALYSVSIEWQEPFGGQTRDYAKMRLITSQGIKNSRIMVNFSPEMAHYLTQAYIMQYPMELLKISEKSANGYSIGKKLLLHHSMGKNRKSGTDGIISVKKLLEAAPDIPSYEEVAADDRHFDRRIISALSKTLDSLSGSVIDHWYYCNAKGHDLNQEQLQNFSYAVFIDCYIRFQVNK